MQQGGLCTHCGAHHRLSHRRRQTYCLTRAVTVTKKLVLKVTTRPIWLAKLVVTALLLTSTMGLVSASLLQVASVHPQEGGGAPACAGRVLETYNQTPTLETRPCR